MDQFVNQLYFKEVRGEEEFTVLVKLVLALSLCVLLLVIVLSYSYGRMLVLKFPKLAVVSLLVSLAVIALIILTLV